jgi:nitroimidazol reductase NimA-like FMN-containing flavoprotein (pyridoxamine 5'-phosphate oxidase superfamily)
MEAQVLSQAERDKIVGILGAAADLTIATLREDGWPQATVVSFVSDGAAIYFGTYPKSQKALNIARDNRVSVALTDPYRTWDEIRGVSLGGRARRVTEPDELARVAALMAEKFPQIAQFITAQSPDDLAIFRIDARVISVLDYTKGFGHTELFRVAD